MKQKIIAIMVIIMIAILSGCAQDDQQQSDATADLTYSEETFQLSLLHSSGNMMNITPNGKTIYTYFTGVG